MASVGVWGMCAVTGGRQRTQESRRTGRAAGGGIRGKDRAKLVPLQVKGGEVGVNLEDKIGLGSCITRDGEIVHEATWKAMGEREGAVR